MKTENWMKLSGIVFVAGFVLATIFFALGGKLKEVDVGLVKLEMPDNTSLTAPLQQASANPTQSSASQSFNWQLNPILPQPQGYTGWISTEDPRDFESGVWTQGINVSINENQLLLVFGGLAKLPTVGEIGTRTSCFVIVSRGPLNLSLDLMSARIEVHTVDATATSLAWAAQKAKILQEVYPSTCGEGLDIVIGK